MFEPHLSQIMILRKSPKIKNLQAAINYVRKRNADMAAEACSNVALRLNSNKDQSKRVEVAWQFSDLVETVRPFVDLWNKWRDFYWQLNFEPKPWEPKNISQVRMIQSIMKIAEEKELDLDVFIGCCFKAFPGRAQPYLTMVNTSGIELYNKYREQVYSDITDSRIMEKSLTRWY